MGDASLLAVEPNIKVETNTTLDSDQNKDVVTNIVRVDLNNQVADSTTVVNHSEVIISESVPEQAAAAEPQPVAVAEISQVVEEINHEANAESTSNQKESEQQQDTQAEANSTTDKSNAQSDEQPKSPAEASQPNTAAEEQK